MHVLSLSVLTMLVFSSAAVAGEKKAEKSHFKSRIDMLDYMECVSKSTVPGSDRGLYIGEIYKYDKVEKAGMFNGKTLYGCVSGEWINFNPENEILASHFSISRSWVREKCANGGEVVFKDAWEDEKNLSQKFAVRLNCQRLGPLLK
jgi:hypothetical protein